MLIYSIMKVLEFNKISLVKILLCMLLTIIPLNISNAQQIISFGIHADPLISWFSTDVKEVTHDGARAGFHFGFTFNMHSPPNYSLEKGTIRITARGRLVSSDPAVRGLSKSKNPVLPAAPT